MALSTFKNEKKCLVLFNGFNGCKTVYDVCKVSDIFEEVLLVKTEFNNNWIQIWNRRYHYFFLYNSLSWLCNTFVFEKIIFFVVDPLNVSYVIKEVLNRNPQCEFCIAEDGIGSYLSNKLYLPNKKQLFWLNLLERRKYYKKISCMYLLHPELLAYKPVQLVRKISKKGFETPVFKEITKKIFRYRKMSECDYILLHQPLAQDGSSFKNVSDAQDRIFKLIDLRMKNKKAYIKLHPRTKKFIQFENCTELDNNSPFEIMIDKNINNCTVITMFSTAAFTPYMLFGYKPRIILLFRLCDGFVFADDMNKFLTVFLKQYKEVGGELFIPETIEELNSLISI